MLRIEKHFEKKLNKLAAAKDQADKEAGADPRQKQKASSSLNKMTFTKL